MSNLKSVLTSMTIMVLGHTPAALAIQPVGQPRAPSGEIHSPTPFVSADAVAAAALRAGTISAVSSDHQSAVISGKTFLVKPPQTRVFSAGLEVGAAGLRTGEKVKFNLSPSDRTHSTLGVVYVN